VSPAVAWIDEACTRALIDVASAHRLVVDALVEHGRGRSSLSQPRSLFLRSGLERPFFHLKGASLDTSGLVGFRIGAIVEPALVGREVRWLILCDRDTAEPVAILEERSLYRMRVGASIAIAIEHLRASSARTLAMIGAGPLAAATLEAVAAVTPFELVRIASRSQARLQALQKQASTWLPRVVASSSVSEATADADVVVALTTAASPILGVDVLRPGVLVLPCGGKPECDPALFEGADRIFVDDWVQCTLLGDIAPLAEAGRLTEADVAGTLAGLVSGDVLGRTDDRAAIVAVIQGLSLLDVALGVGALQKWRAARGVRA